MSSRYLTPVKRLGTAAVIFFLIGILFPVISSALLSEETRKAVLINAIPFFGFFIGILLLFILLIVIIARRYNGKVPLRTYSGIEQIIIAGILMGVVCLFQPWSIVPYRYGFLLLLAATLGFIVWSHTVPRSQKTDDLGASLTTPLRVIAVISGLLVGLLLSFDSNTIVTLQVGVGLSLPFKPIHGFLVFVVSLLIFLIWTSITDPTSGAGLPVIGTRQNFIGVAAAVTVLIVLTYAAVAVNAPHEPYGIRERLWNSYSDEKKATIASAAAADFQSVELPFLIIFNLFPAGFAFFIAREVAAEADPNVMALDSIPIAETG